MGEDRWWENALCDEDGLLPWERPFNFEIAKQRLAEFLEASQRTGYAPSQRALDFTLNDEGCWQDRVRAWQQVRDAGLLPYSAGSFLIAQSIEARGEERANRDPATRALRRRSNDIERAAGYDPRGDIEVPLAWVEHEAPPEYHRIWDELHRIERAHTAATYREYGEHALAGLLENRPDEYDAMREAGRRFFLPPLPPNLYYRLRKNSDAGER